MKSEFYREISVDRKQRKSVNKNKKTRETLNSSHINPIRMSKGFKSETRAMVRSIDLNKQYKLDTDQRIHRMSFSKPVVDLQEDYEIPQIAEKSIVSVCCDCQNLRVQHQKQLRSLKMSYEQQKTFRNEQYILMQKKYLIKENENIKLSAEYSRLTKINEALESTLRNRSQELQHLQRKYEEAMADLEHMHEQYRKIEEHMKCFNSFLTVFVQQTRWMLHWVGLFEKNCQRLPSTINLVKQDLCQRKENLDAMLVESINYQAAAFSKTEKKQLNQCSFLGSQEEDSSSNLMKYLKHNSRSTKQSNIIKVSPFSERRDKSFNSAFTNNKENIDTTNRLSFQELIHSRLQEQLSKQKEQEKKDQIWRLLFAQAQFIESHELKSQQSHNSQHSNFFEGVLSSIKQKKERDHQ